MASSDFDTKVRDGYYDKRQTEVHRQFCQDATDFLQSLGLSQQYAGPALVLAAAKAALISPLEALCEMKRLANVFNPAIPA